MKKSRIYEDQSFHMEPYTPDTHSLTQEEIEAELDRNTAEAIEGIASPLRSGAIEASETRVVSISSPDACAPSVTFRSVTV